MSHREFPEEWITAARQGFVDAWKLMAGNLPAGAATFVDGLAIATTGMMISGCNPAMAVAVPENPAATLDYARRFYESRNVPWTLYAAGDAADALAPHTETVGLKPAYVEPAMFLRREDARRPVAPPGFQIQLVWDEATMERYCRTAALGFETTPEGFEIWANTELIGTPGLHYYLGLQDGEPVATSCVYGLHGVATINMVSTIPAFRRRGLGEVMTWKAVEDGFQMGCDVAFLHASEMGFPVYRRMGFREAFVYRIWSAPKLS